MTAPLPLITPGCPARTALDMLGGKWRLLLLHLLAPAPLRYSELRQQLPDISEKVLTQELRNLLDADLLTRAADTGTYALIERGRLGLPVLAALQAFGLAYVGKAVTAAGVLA